VQPENHYTVWAVPPERWNIRHCRLEVGALYVTPTVTFSNSTLCSHSAFMCSVWTTEQRLFPSTALSDLCLLHSTNIIGANMRYCAHIQHNSVNIYRKQTFLQQTQYAKWTHTPQTLIFFPQISKQFWVNTPKRYAAATFSCFFLVCAVNSSESVASNRISN
jgi:hypothetical protein